MCWWWSSVRLNTINTTIVLPTVCNFISILFFLTFRECVYQTNISIFSLVLKQFIVCRSINSRVELLRTKFSGIIFFWWYCWVHNGKTISYKSASALNCLGHLFSYPSFTLSFFLSFSISFFFPLTDHHHQIYGDLPKLAYPHNTHTHWYS